MTQNDVMTIAHLAMSMTEKLYNMKEAGLINDYKVISTAKDWDDEKYPSTISIKVNEFAYHKEKYPELSLEFDDENAYSPDKVEAFNWALNDIIATAMNEAEERLNAAQAQMDVYKVFKNEFVKEEK